MGSTPLLGPAKRKVGTLTVALSERASQLAGYICATQLGSQDLANGTITTHG